MCFEPGLVVTDNNGGDGYWFIFDRHRLLVRLDGDQLLPASLDAFTKSGINPERRLHIGSLDGITCHVTGVDEPLAAPEGFDWQDLRMLIGIWPEHLAAAAGYAGHLWGWDQSSRHCGRCGQMNTDHPDERAKICPKCGLINYPRVSPAVIVAVVDRDRILLARNRRFRGPFFSVLAGFVEPGETLEACVRREVMEEVGISLDRIRYFGSQPWPFPDSIMIGYTARFSGGTIHTDNDEIIEADWYVRDSLPRVPPKFSIAGRLIDWFVNGGQP